MNATQAPAQLTIARSPARHRACHAARRGEHVPRPVRRHDDRIGDPCGRRIDGGAAHARRQHDPREQHRADRRLGGIIDRLRRHLHGSGAGDPRSLDRLQVHVGARHRRARRHPGRLLLGAAAPLADPGAGPQVSGGRGGRRSAQGRRQSRAGREAARALGARWRPREARRRQRAAADPGHGGSERLLRQVARLFRHEPLARAARRRLHRRPQHRRAGADRRHDLVEHRHPDLRGVFPRRQRAARAEPCWRRCGDDCRRDLVGADPLPRRGRDAGRRHLGADLDPQFARCPASAAASRPRVPARRARSRTPSTTCR